MSVDIEIENSVAFISGAGRGLGLALVGTLLDHGCKKVYAGFRTEAQLDTVLSLGTGNIIPIKLDITNLDEIQRAVSVAGDCNLLFNNAGVFAEGILLDAPIDELRKLIEVNYFGVLNMMRCFTPVMKNHTPSAIINILSISALANVPGIGGYSVSKAAAQSLTQSFRHLLQNDNVKVCGVYPGPLDTDMTSNLSIPKANVRDVAIEILAGLVNGDEDIFPDTMSQQGAETWRSDPKVLERQLALS